MACEKYSKWIAEATLGEPDSKRDAELHAHLSGCPMCRQEFDEASALRLLVDRGIESLVLREPSPDFSASLRARIVEEHVSEKPFAVSIVVPVIAGALAVVALFTIATSHTRRNFRSPAVADIQKQTSFAPEALHPSPVSSPALPARSRTEGSGRPREPQALVPPDQLVLALKLAEGLRAGRVDGRGLIDQMPEETPLEILPMETKALEIPPVNGAAEEVVNPIDRGGL
jgi:hypothetical protein